MKKDSVQISITVCWLFRNTVVFDVPNCAATRPYKHQGFTCGICVDALFDQACIRCKTCIESSKTCTIRKQMSQKQRITKVFFWWVRWFCIVGIALRFRKWILYFIVTLRVWMFFVLNFKCLFEVFWNFLLKNRCYTAASVKKHMPICLIWINELNWWDVIVHLSVTPLFLYRFFKPIQKMCGTTSNNFSAVWFKVTLTNCVVVGMQHIVHVRGDPRSFILVLEWLNSCMNLWINCLQGASNVIGENNDDQVEIHWVIGTCF
jgi:ferredoxin